MVTSEHGGEVVSNEFQQWLKNKKMFHRTAPRGEPNYNEIVECLSAFVEYMAFAMPKHSSKPKSW